MEFLQIFNNFFVPPGPGDENLSIELIRKQTTIKLAYEVEKKIWKNSLRINTLKNTTNLLKMKILNLCEKIKKRRNYSV